MSLKGRLGKAVIRRIEGMPSVQAATERHARIAPTQEAAMAAAYRPGEDDDAKTFLNERLDAEHEVLTEAVLELSGRRNNYIWDRAYRLLSAAVADTEVQPIAPERQCLFAQEEMIGRIPIEQAFDHLSKLEPRLADVKREATHVAPGEGRGELPSSVRESLADLIGHGTGADHELLETTLATSIVHQYLQQLMGNPHLGSPTKAYFDSPNKQFVASHRIPSIRGRGR